MKTYTYTVLSFLLAAIMLSSCLGDDKKVEYTDTCVISSFSLGSIKQAHQMKGSKGQDSTYYTVFAGSVFPMAINQRDLTIENPDSLPYGALVNNVLTNCNFESLLVQRPKNLSGLEAADTLWQAYSSKDSLDFTSPRSFMVISSDGNAMREYTVTVNVHKMDPNATVWDSLGVSDVPCPKDCELRKMAVLGGELKLLTQQAGGQLSAFSRLVSKDGSWKQEALSGAEGAMLETLQQEADMIYMSNEQGHIIYSVDGREWRTRLLGKPGLRLVGVSSTHFYGLLEGKLMATAKDAEAWKEEQLDEDGNMLPAKDITMLPMVQQNGSKRLLLVGKTAEGDAARLWSKAWTEGQGSEAEAGWVYYTENNAIKHIFPLLTQQVVLPYDGNVLLFGGKPEASAKRQSPLATGTALDVIYNSQDYGITWLKHSKMTFDERMTETATEAQLITAAVEDGRFIWVLIDGQLWRGRLNGVAFN